MTAGLEIGSVVDLRLLGGALDMLQAHLDSQGIRPPARLSNLSGAKHPDLVGAWLDRELRFDSNGRPGDEQAAADIVQLAIDAMSSSYAKVPHYPQWVTVWPVLENALGDGPSRWTEIMGVWKARPTCLMMLKYTVNDAQVLARPTQLDAGDYGWHHPSPGSAPASSGGHPMDLGLFPLALHPEFVHPPIIYRPEYYIPDSLRRLSPASTDASGSAIAAADVLKSARTTHRSLLERAYPVVWPAWFACPDAPPAAPRAMP